MLIPIGIVAAGLLASVLWSRLINHTDIINNVHYGIKLNPVYWAFTALFSSTVALVPVPTSLVLTGAWSANGVLIGIVTVGVVASILEILLLVPRLATSLRGTLKRFSDALTTLELSDGQLIALFTLASLVPAAFIKAGELYATQMTPFLKTLLVLALASTPSLLVQYLSSTISGLCVLASVVNIMFYSIASGYDPMASYLSRLPGEKLLYRAIQNGVDHRSKSYSIYAYQESALRERHGGCIVDRTEPTACLPEDISRGFPVRRGQD